MLLGTLLTIGAISFVGPRQVGLMGAFLCLTTVFTLILFLAQPVVAAICRLIFSTRLTEAPRKGEISLGASMMYLGTLFSAGIALIMEPRAEWATFFISLFSVFSLLLLISHYVMRSIRSLMSEDQPKQVYVQHSPIVAGTSSDLNAAPLVAVLSKPVPEAALPKRATTGEMALPASVTEHTTNFLENK
jgi:hypothetical protein